MRVFFSAGEASGDAYAGALAMRLNDSETTIEGIGGKHLTEQANGPVLDSSRWGAISIGQSIIVAPRVFLGFLKAKAQLKRGRPGLVVAIDFGFFNIRLIRHAKRNGWKVLYFIPPGSWRRKLKRTDLVQTSDEIVCPFPWNVQSYGEHAHFFGHPIQNLIEDWRITREAGDTRNAIAILPGSRRHEIERNLPLLARILAEFPEVTAEFAVAPTLQIEEIRRMWRGLARDRQDTFSQSDVYGVLSRSKAAVVCSGTATLEAALLRCPMVVIYQVTRSMAFEAKLIGFKIPQFISLPNIVLERKIVQEHVGFEVDPKAVASDLRKILEPGATRVEQLNAFVEIDRDLGPSDALERSAELARRLMDWAQA